MIELRLEDIHKQALTLYNTFSDEGQIYPPFNYCTSDDVCVGYILEQHKLTYEKISKLLSTILLDGQKPRMTIEELFFVRERLSFAMFLSGAINPHIEGGIGGAHYSEDVDVNIRGTSTEHFLMWLLDHVFLLSGEEELLCQAQKLAQESRKLQLTNAQWLLMRQDHIVE